MAKEVRFRFSHRTTTYTFTGRSLEPPAPGTYDPKAYTPPTRQILKVEMQDDGMWRILMFDTQISSGDSGQAPSRQNALRILEKHCLDLLQKEDSESEQ